MQCKFTRFICSEGKPRSDCMAGEESNDRKCTSWIDIWIKSVNSFCILYKNSNGCVFTYFYWNSKRIYNEGRAHSTKSGSCRYTKLSIDNALLTIKIYGTCLQYDINLLKPNNMYICRTAALTSRRYILNIYSTNIHTEYFKHAA